MRHLKTFVELDDFVDEVLHAHISDVILDIFYFVDLSLVLRVRAVTNRFPDPSIFAFDPDDVVSIISRMPNFSEIYKISYFFS